MLKYAVIVAGGSGARMGTIIPKQFLHVAKTPVLIHTVRSFLVAYADIRIILVLPADHLETGSALVREWLPGHDITVVAGGETRFQSVKNGLAGIGEKGIVLVHDAVRCLVSPELIRRCHDAALQYGSAIPAIRSKDSVRLREGSINRVIDRSSVMLIQTPQTFQSDILLKAFEQDADERFTDEATVVEAIGLPVTLVEGEDTNIKITTPIDMVVAEQIIATIGR